MQVKYTMLNGECWWGGTSADGILVPFDGRTEIRRDFRIVCPNQTMPLLLSNRGRCIWSEEPFAVTIADGTITVEGEGIVSEQFGHTLRDAFLGASQAHFPVSGDPLEEEFFKKPQYNTWMQFTYNPTQEGVLRYAHEIVEHGFLPGILIIDEGWQKEYGVWEFDPYKFPDPKTMVDELHAMGFTLMLWVVPYVRADGYEFVKKTMPHTDPLFYDKRFMRTEDGTVAITRWWNGYSATFDMTKECDRDEMDRQLSALMADYGIDGFKFDGGTTELYSDSRCINGKLESSHTYVERNIAWNEFGTKYRFHEYKDTFKGGGKRVIQRLQDRNHSWDQNGLNTLIPNAIQQGLLGHAFICPDMIGGGEWTARYRAIDEELFVRMAQCSALFPMMQFSWAPWDAVNEQNLAYIKEAHDLHVRFSDTILSLVRDAYRTGEPILRPLAYNYPDCGYEYIHDAFMLGDNILVSPVVEKGQTVKKVVLPAGDWVDGYGREFRGGTVLEYPAPLGCLPYFIRKK